MLRTMATKLSADHIAKLDPYKFMAVIGKRVMSSTWSRLPRATS
jgi:hypothetical protein